MKHVGIFISSKSHSDTLRSLLSGNDLLNLIEINNQEQLLQLLQFGTKFHLIVTDHKLADLGDFNALVLKWDPLSSDMSLLMGQIVDQLSDQMSDGYISMPLHLFVHFRQLPVDVYIKINKEGHPHFVQRFFAQDEITREDLENFKSRGLAELWLEKESIKLFSKEVIATLKGEIQKQSVAVSDIHSNERVFHTLGDMIKKVGVKPAVVDLCDTWMTNLAKSSLSSTHTPIKDWYQRLSQDPTLDFHFKLVRLTTLLCGQYVLSTDWVTKEEQASRLAGVALFADMSLSEPKFIHYRTYDMAQELKGEDKLLVLSHAQRSSQIITRANFVTKDVSLLVAQHHGSPDGEKIPQKISANVSPLAYVYLLSEEMGYSLLKDSNLPLKDVYEGLKKKFTGTPVATYVAALSKILDIN